MSILSTLPLKDVNLDDDILLPNELEEFLENNFYSKLETETKLENYYKKSETSSATQLGEFLENNFYSKSETDSKLEDHYKKSETSSAAELNEAIGDIEKIINAINGDE